ncbi:hypothetical protein [Pimelobacter simplex]|uniref:hypothetical protein n=1 Tax=Nocardioides simplex TaxID=2045 RepID=UPI003AAF3C0D
MTDNPNQPTNPTGEPGGETGETFTQADVDAAVDKIAAKIRAEERKKASEKFADYDDLKAKAEGAKTLEDRITELETAGTQAAQRALRAEIASEFGISTKRETGKDGNKLPSDADLFLTATDQDGLRKQAERLAGRESERKKNNAHVPREGETPKTPALDGKRAWLQSLKDD